MPNPAADDPTRTDPSRRVPLHTKILAGLVVGVAAGLAANFLGSRPVIDGVASASDQNANGVADWLDAIIAVADPLGRVFLRLVLMVVIPLVFSALTLGVLELGDVRRLGRVGLRTLGWTLVLSFCAVGIGLTLVNVIQPGSRLSEAKREALRAQYAKSADVAIEQSKKAKSLSELLLDIIPENPLQEMVGALDGSSKGNGMLSVMFFSLCIGLALTVAGPRAETLVRVIEGLFDVTMVIIGFAMRLAPFCVACLVFVLTARMGIDILTTLLWFVFTVLLGMALQVVVVYSACVWLGGGRKPLEFFRQISEAMLTAFGTSSSNATLPTALRVAQHDLGLPREVSQFVLTIGSTGNQNGTALYEGVVVLFLAQVLGVELTLSQQLTVVLMSVLAGVGTAGVPGGSLPLIVMVLQSLNLAPESIGIILGIDRILDMCRTTLNVSGDLVLATCVARGERTTDAKPAAA
ncbi:MAG TPA: dicarboxylate/amino acid:cation symporter [Pirellulales bacterium]|nr:dicarboxylate/amino acid:cation symporter [Pirellulales bacterium]